ncbi:MAG TPA: GDP-mannose 4,6-dehydratase [Terriglobales bacterium]|nr:GDP-mannose 4,6-dehydratase [Terriglobales bacterium]
MKMRKYDSKQNILIFGGAGFIGSNWASWLLQNTDANVHIYDNLSRRGVRFNLESLKKIAGRSGRLRVTVADIREADEVERAVRDVAEVYHFAAQVAVTTSVLDPRLDFDINLRGTFNVLEGIRKAGHKPFLLFTSTNKVYGELGEHSTTLAGSRWAFREIKGVSELQPLDFYSPYGCSKGAADQYVHDYARIYDIPTVVFRMSCIAGPRQFGNEDQGWVAHFLYSAIQQIPLVIYGDGRQVRDVLCVDDLVRAFDVVRSNETITRGNVYNVGGGPENTTSLLELLAEIEKLIGTKVQYVKDDSRPGDQLVYVTDYGKLKRHTGWKPQFNVRQTLLKIQDWWKNNRDIFEPVRVAEPVMSPTLQDLQGAA